MESTHKHLEFLQLTITRMAANSFLIKGWSVTLVSALFVLSDGDADRYFALFALVPAILFWGLDGYFIWQERRFRLIYDVVRLKKDSEIDFAMYYSEIENLDSGWFLATFSKTLIVFHGVLVATIFAVVYFYEMLNAS